MKNKILYFVFLSGLFLSLSLTQNEKRLYQVISSHPHELEELESQVETVYQNGRLWIVELKAEANDEILSHLRPITGREKSYLFEASHHKQAKLLGGELKIKALIAQMSSQRIHEAVLDLTSYRTRAANTEDNRKVTKQLIKNFKDMGYEVRQTCYRKRACSVVADKIGSKRPEEVILVLAHFDSVGKDFAGADDNASGTAVLLEMARVLKDYKNQKTLRFFATNGEELGLLGAKHYVKELKSSGEIKQIKFAVNMDMVGYNQNGIVELETDHKYESMAQWYARLASKYTELKTKITLGAWGSDHVPFIQAGVPALLTIEDWSTKTPCYHAACDTPDTLNYQYATEIGKLNLSAVLTKDLE